MEISRLLRKFAQSIGSLSAISASLCDLACEPMDCKTGDPRSAAPSLWVKLVAVAAILGAGVCGALIGYALVDISCEGDCSSPLGLGILVGSVSCAAGVAVTVAITLRAMVIRPTARQRREGKANRPAARRTR